MMERRSARLGALAGVLFGTCLFGCSSRAHDDAPKPIAECDAYVASMRACMRSMGPNALAAAEPNLAKLGESLLPHDDAERASMQAKCIASRTRLSGACR